jgi:endonuclease-3
MVKRQATNANGSSATKLSAVNGKAIAHSKDNSTTHPHKRSGDGTEAAVMGCLLFISRLYERMKAAPIGKNTRRRRPAVLTVNAIETLFARFQAANPDPKTELEYTDAFTLLVAVVLSAQATDVSVNKATKGLFQVAATPLAMRALGIDGIKRHIKTIGLYNSKAQNIYDLCGLLLEKHGGIVPSERAALEELPGVGRKTANVVLNCAFGQPTMAVDTHVFRVSKRLALSSGKNPLAVELDLLKNIPPGYLYYAHHWLILHGRYVCKARMPNCGDCVIRDVCLKVDVQ